MLEEGRGCGRGGGGVVRPMKFRRILCRGLRACGALVAFAALAPIGRNANALPLPPLRPSLTSESYPGRNPAMDPESDVSQAGQPLAPLSPPSAPLWGAVAAAGLRPESVRRSSGLSASMAPLASGAA